MAVLRNQPDVLELLVHHGADINRRDRVQLHCLGTARLSPCHSLSWSGVWGQPSCFPPPGPHHVLLPLGTSLCPLSVVLCCCGRRSSCLWLSPCFGAMCGKRLERHSQDKAPAVTPCRHSLFNTYQCFLTVLQIHESSPLDLASEEPERLPCLRRLLQLGANVNAADKNGLCTLPCSPS